MATIQHSIKTYKELAHCANSKFIGCIDNTLPAGHGVISHGADGNMRHWVGSIGAPKTSWIQLTVEDKSSKALAIGQGHFAVGKEIFKFGQAEPVCTVEESVESGTQGNRITRMLPSGDVLQIWCESLGKLNPHFEPHVIICMVCSIVNNRVEVKSETYTRIDAMNLGVYYIKGYIVMECDFNQYKLIDLAQGKEVDIAFRPGFSQIRFIDSFTKLGVFTRPDIAAAIDDYDDKPDEYRTLYGTLDIQDGKFAFLECVNRKSELCKTIKNVYGIPSTTPIGWTDCMFALDTVLVVNFRLNCCLSHPANNATPGGHACCVLHSTPHTDTYGLIYLATKTVIRLRERPVFGKVLSNTPEVISSHYSHDRRYLAMVVKSTEAIAIPTSNLQVVVIDTNTGKYDIGFSLKIGGSNTNDSIPSILAVHSGPEPSVIFQVFGFTFNQPIFKARTEAIANKLYELAQGSMPIEVMIHIAAYCS